MRSSRRMCVCAIVVFSCALLAQLTTQVRTLMVNDYSGELGIVQMHEKTYVDLDRLVEIAHGSIDYHGTTILLRLPGPAVHTSGQSEKPEESDHSRFSREFMKAGIEEISLIREWASTVANAVQNGYPITDNWVATYRAQAQKGLALTSAAVSNNSDRDGVQLLTNELEAVKEWSNKLLEAQKSMNTGRYAVSDSALHDDPLSQKIVNCGRFLGQILANGSFQDDSSCH